MRRIHASLDLLEERNAAAAAAAGATGGNSGSGEGGKAATGRDEDAAGAEQPAALDLLMASRDEDGNRLTRQATHFLPLASMPYASQRLGWGQPDQRLTSKKGRRQGLLTCLFCLPLAWLQGANCRHCADPAVCGARHQQLFPHPHLPPPAQPPRGRRASEAGAGASVPASCQSACNCNERVVRCKTRSWRGCHCTSAPPSPLLLAG